MKCNVGGTEKSIRIIVGIVIIAAGIFLRSWWGIIGLAPLITGAIGYCPLSQALGTNTCEEHTEKDKI